VVGPHRVVIVGGGFAGLYCAQKLKRARAQITLIDRRNFHLFQPLLYQVASGALSPAEIASPLRVVLSAQKNARVWLGEVVDFDPGAREVILSDGARTGYDTLVVATGSRHHYFGRGEWESRAPGLKTIEDATEIRRRILLAFEKAEREPDPEERRALLTFVIVGGGPTGVELAGALGEIANDTLRNDFRLVRPPEANILLLEGSDRILSAFPPGLSVRAESDLIRLGVRTRTRAVVTELDAKGVTVKLGDRIERIHARTVLWAAGVQASPLGKLLAERTGAHLDRAGRVVVEPDLSIPGYPDIFAIGDLANFSHQLGQPLPGIAPAAMSQGRYVARLVRARLEGRKAPPYRYLDKGTLATIGRSRAVAVIAGLRFAGPLAWLVWLFVHLMYLVEFENRVLVLIRWAYNYFTRNRGARLITGPHD